MIQVRGLTKYYGEHAAIRDLDFDIERGQVLGFLGLNGAGKTTTLKVLGCVLLPTSGTVTIDGIDVIRHAHEVRSKIGFLPDTPPLYNEMTVGAYLRFAAQIRGVSSRDTAARVREAEEKTDLVEKHDALISSLSHGYRQRVGVAQALVHKPALLILDEPTAGLDPVQIVEMRRLIRALRGEHTVLISSHFLSEISQTCDRLLVIQGGEIVASGSESELAAKMGKAGGGGDLEITVRGSADRIRELLTRVPGIVDVTLMSGADGDGAAPASAETATVLENRFRVSAAGDLRADIARTVVNAGLDLLRIDRASSRLESVFIELARTAEREGADDAPPTTIPREVS